MGNKRFSLSYIRKGYIWRHLYAPSPFDNIGQGTSHLWKTWSINSELLRSKPFFLNELQYAYACP